MTANPQKRSSFEEHVVRRLVEIASHPTLLTSNDGTILAANSAACSLLGLTRKTLLRRNVKTFFPGAKTAFPPARASGKRKGKTIRRTLRLEQDGSSPVRCIVRISRLPEGRILLTIDPSKAQTEVASRRAKEDFDPINALIESNHEFFGIADLDTTVTYINRAGRRMCGLLPDGPLPKMKILDTIPDFFHPQFLNVIVPAVRRDGRWHGEGWLRRVDNNVQIPVEVEVFTVVTPGSRKPKHIATVIRDLSENKRSETALRRYAEDLGAIHLLGTQVNASLSLDRVIAAAVDGIRLAVQCDRIYMYLRDGERFVLRNPDSEFAEHPAMREIEFSDAETLCNRAVHQQSSLFVNDLLSFDDGHASEFRSFAAVPLRRGARVLGVFGIGSYTGMDFASRGALLETIAETISIGLTNAILFTSTKEAGEALRKSEERFRMLVEQISEAIIVQTNSRFAYLNNAALRLFGAASADQLIGKPIIDRIHPDYRAFVLQRIAQTNEAKQTAPLADMVFVRLDGSFVSVESAAAPITFGGADGSVIFAFDMEGRRSSERAVRESEERLKRAQAVAHIGNWELDLQTHAIWGSDEAFRIYGVDRETSLLTLSVVQQSVLTKYRPTMDLALRLLIGEGKPYEQEFEISRADDGRVRWVYSKAELIRDPEGKPFRVVGVIQDITDRKRADEALRESEELYRKLITTIPDVIIRTDMEGNIIFINETGFPALGYETNERVLGKNMLAFVAEKDRELAMTNMAKMVHNYLGPVEYTLVGDDGTFRECEVNGDVLLNFEEMPIGMVFLIRDITERRQHDLALRKNEYFLRKSQDIARIGSYVLDTSTGDWESSRTLEDIFGISASYHRDVESWLAIVHPEEREAMGAYFRHDIMTLHHRFDRTYRIVRISDGEERWVHGQGELELDSSGNTVRMIGTIQDVTERKHYETAIVAALHEKEVLLKEIHHRVKNNMQVISSLLSLQGSKIDDPAMKSMLFESMYRIRSMALVHERLYKANNLASIDFRDYLNSMASELTRSFPRNEITVRVEAESMQVGVDLAIPCGLIANELISNAYKHAFPDGRQGTILISLRRLADDRAELRVRDDGVGYALKADDHAGESLGLTIIDALVDQISGRLTSERREGTTVVVDFPLV